MYNPSDETHQARIIKQKVNTRCGRLAPSYNHCRVNAITAQQQCCTPH